MSIAGGLPTDTYAPPLVPWTPVEADPPYASWGRRVVATLLDGALASAVSYLALGVYGVGVPFVGATLLSPAGGTTDGPPWTDSGWLVGTVVLSLLMQAYLGATPGKLTVGIAVVRSDDARPAGLLRTLARWFAHLIDAFLLIGYLRPLWHAQHRTFADSLLSTVVLTTRSPRRHVWFRDADSRADPGPPLAWTAPLAPDWQPVVSALSMTACVVGVLFSVGSSSTVEGTTTLSCSMTVPDDGQMGLTAGSVSFGGKQTTTRLGVTRSVPVTGGEGTATWEWSRTPGVAQQDALLRLTVSRIDGSAVHTQDFPLPDPEALSATVPVSDDLLSDIGSTYVVSQSVVVDGVESPLCTSSLTRPTD